MTVTGSIKRADNIDNAQATVLFTPIDINRVLGSDIGTKKPFTAITDNSGNFSVVLTQGTYQVNINSGRDIFKITVPTGSGSANISTMLILS